LPFYIAYRAVVRAKVEGMQLAEREIPSDQRKRILRKAEAHWLMALGVLEEPARRPCLVLVGGLPGTGKSTLARGLGAAGSFQMVRSDAIRKELAGVPEDKRATGCYTPEWTDRTYAECLRRADEILRDGGRVIVDATFSDEGRREEFLDAARRLSVPAMLFICRLDPELAHERLQNRKGDASDADWAVYEDVAAHWERMSEETERDSAEIDTTHVDRALRTATHFLSQSGLI
jgi:predicted kinase